MILPGNTAKSLTLAHSRSSSSGRDRFGVAISPLHSLPIFYRNEQHSHDPDKFNGNTPYVFRFALRVTT